MGPSTDFHIVSNDCGNPQYGLGLLANQDKISALTVSYVGENSIIGRKWLSGKLAIYFTPQVNIHVLNVNSTFTGVVK